MARARVELKGCLTFQGKGRTFKKGSPQILTNPADIMYYQQQAVFVVTMLSEKSKVVVETKQPVDNIKDDNDFNESELRKMKKADLQEVAEELGLDTEGTVNELIERILDAQ